MKKLRIIISSIVVLVIVIIVISLVYHNQRVKVYLDSCIDGDTAWFLIHNKKEKVRFLGIDTPILCLQSAHFNKPSNK